MNRHKAEEVFEAHFSKSGLVERLKTWIPVAAAILAVLTGVISYKLKVDENRRNIEAFKADLEQIQLEVRDHMKKLEYEVDGNKRYVHTLHEIVLERTSEIKERLARLE